MERDAARGGARGAMSGRKTIDTAVITESAAHAALRRGPAPALAPDEERALRMRLGAALPRHAALERLATATDADIDVLAWEVEAWMKRRDAARPSGPVAAPSPSRTKEKIVRALRRKS
jgi:hypothetical protein